MKGDSIHVVHILPALRVGGAERCVVNLINNMPQNVRQTVLLFEDVMPFAVHIRQRCEVVVIEKKDRLPWQFIFHIEKELRNLAPDLVNTHLFGADLWGRIAAVRARIPVVTTEHNVNYGESGLHHLVKRFLRPLSACYIAPSFAISRYMQSAYSIGADDIAHVPYGIEMDEFLALPAPSFVSSHPLRLLFFGRLTHQKGADILLHALRFCADLPWTLSIYGEGEDEAMLRNLAHSLSLSSRVSFFPFSNDASEMLSNHDVVCMPSRYEGFGIAAVESCAAARATVVSGVDGLLEHVDDGVTGLVVRGSGAESWAATLRDILLHRESLSAIAFAGRDMARAEYDVSRMVDGYMRVYEKVLSRGNIIDI